MKNENLLKVFAKYVSLNVLGMIALSCYILADTFFCVKGVGGCRAGSVKPSHPRVQFYPWQRSDDRHGRRNKIFYL